MKELQTKAFIDEAVNVFWNDLDGVTTDDLYREYELICADHEFVPESKSDVTRYLCSEYNLKCDIVSSTRLRVIEAIRTEKQIKAVVDSFDSLNGVSTLDLYREYERQCFRDSIDPESKAIIMDWVFKHCGVRSESCRVSIFKARNS